MILFRALGLAAAVALLFFGFVFARDAAPNPSEHERLLTSMLTAFLDDAALQRDVLQARTGRLRNYDPLNERMGRLQRTVTDLRGASRIANGDSALALRRGVEEIAALVQAREDTVERFKSRNALVHNSIQIFSHSVERVTRAVSVADPTLVADLGGAAIAMLRFVDNPGEQNQDEIGKILARLKARVPTDPDLRAMISHGSLISASLPVTERLATELQTPLISDRVRVLHANFLRARAAVELRAGWLQRGLYAAAVSLALYIAALLLRLRYQTEALKRRLALEHATAAISSHFIELPSDRASDGMAAALALLARYSGAEEVHVVAADEAGEILLAHHWPEQVCETSPRELLARGAAEARSFANLDEALPGTCIFQRLAELRRRMPGGDGWSAFPLRGLDAGSGYVMFKSPPHMAGWAAEDRVILGMAAEIFSMALRRSRNEEERQELERRLAQAQRLESLGTLAGGIAHEFNNILGGMLGHAEMAQLSLRRNSPTRRHLEQVIKGGARAQAVIDNVLAFGRRRSRTVERLDPALVVQEALDLLRASLPDAISLSPSLTEGAAISGDTTELQQVVLNLCTNAAHAMGGAGNIALTLAVEELAVERALSHGHLARGRFVRLEVADHGSGIAPAVMRRMFEPFFTTKQAGSGTGLGLSTVHGIATAWGGGVHVISRPGAGTKVQVFLPTAPEEQPGTEPPEEEGRPMRGGGQAILLVQPQRKQLLLDEEILAALGYEPVGFERAEDAVAAVAGDPERFSAALVDLPGPDGPALSRQLAQRCPGLTVILLADADAVLDGPALRRSGIKEVLRKPVRSRGLSECLVRQLSSARRVRLVPV